MTSTWIPARMGTYMKKPGQEDRARPAGLDCLIAIAFAQLLLSGCGTLQPLHYSVEARGRPVYRFPNVRPGEAIAEAGFPNHYLLVDPDRIAENIEPTLQDLGFSFKPRSEEEHIPECSSDASQRREPFWTDSLLLDDRLLARFCTSRARCGLSADASTRYSIKIVGCWHISTDGSKAVERANQISDHIPRTTIDLTIALTLYKAGSQSAFVQQRKGYHPQPILDWIAQQIQDRASGLKPSDTPVNRDGSVTL